MKFSKSFYNREEHIVRDQDSKALGPVILSNLTILTSCKILYNKLLGYFIINYYLFSKLDAPVTNSELLKGDSKGLLKLPTDKVLVEDPEFRKYVILYAEVRTYSHLYKIF